MTSEQLMELLFVAANAQTDEEKARVAWRASDHMWRDCMNYGIGSCRSFNNLCQDKAFPWVENLWSEEEIKKIHAKYEGLIR